MGELDSATPENDTARGRRGLGWWLLGVVIVALAMRLVYLSNSAEMPFVRHLVGDAAGYWEWAAEIADGDWLGSTSFYQAPLYPYYMAVLFTLAGESISGIRVIQSVGGVLAVGLLALAACRTFDRRTGLLAGLLLALYGPAIFFDGVIQKTSLGCLLVCLLLVVIAVEDRRRWWLLAGTAGVVMGLLTLTRENAMVWLPLVAVWLWVSGSRSKGRLHSGRVVAYVIGFGVVLIPVGLRNVAVSGEWSVSTFQAGPNFYIGNGANADGRYRPLVRGHETPAFERRDATELAEQALGQQLSAREVSRYWMRRGLEDIKSEPGRWLRLLGLKMAMVWNAYEVSDIESAYVYADYSPLLRALMKVWHFGVLCPLAAAGVVLTRHRWRELWIYYALIVSMACAVALFYVLARYRFPLVPLLIPFGAAGCVKAWDLLRSGSYRRLIGPAIAALLVAVLVNLPVHDERRLDALAQMNLGATLARTGDLKGATLHFRRAVDRHPESAEAHNNLGQALALQGEFAAAIPHYEAALAASPTLIGVDYNLAVALERVSRVEEACRHYRRAVELDPEDEDARLAIARLCGQ